MSLSDIKFKLSYNNQEDDVVKDFLLPALKESVEYDRAVGFFSSTSLMSISVGIKHLVENGGHIRLICSPRLSDEDIEAINSGYDRRKVIEDCINREFVEPKDSFEEERLNMLSHLISDKKMDIKIATMKKSEKNSMFHIKLGIIIDSNNNFVAFNGSMNDSENAFYGNSESIDVYSSISSDYLRAYDKKRFFDKMWSGEENYLDITDFPDSTIERINSYKKDDVNFGLDLEEYSAKNISHKKSKFPEVPNYITIRDYQYDAYENWQKMNYCGIYDMATGTGKTYTALYSIVEFLKVKNQKLAVVICCPYQHLVNQWSEDLDEFGFKYIMGFSGSKQKDWKRKLKKSAFNYSHKLEDGFCFITTNASFASGYVQDVLSSINRDILLVIDEAHNFGTHRLSKMLDDRFKYRLALSATLERHNDLVGTTYLYDYFKGKCIEYTLEMAIKAGMLCDYLYYPVKIYLEDDEYEKYNELSSELQKYIKKNDDGTIEYSKKAEMILIKRSRIVAGARMKLEVLKEVASKYSNDNHLLVYCGSTTVVDSDYVENKASSEEIRQIDAVSSVLNSLGMITSQFTSNEDSRTREILKSEFDSGEIIQALVAIRCLDEGVNIPSIDKAIIMASSTNPKEYIQRRGRVLRIYKGKTHAIIYDFVTLPRKLEDISSYTDFGYDLGLIKREISRVKDFARLSLNECDSYRLINEIEDVYGYIKEGAYYE